MQVTDAMVAKAAEVAYLRNRAGDKPWDDLSPEHKSEWREKVRPVITAVLAEMWRDIETAPKDGSPILIAGGTYYNSMSLFNEDYPFEGQTIAKWDDYHRQWRGENSGGHDEYFWHKPTHFMPLPPPPMGRG